VIFNKKNIATFIAILFHVSGWIGIAFTPYKDWFISLTPLNLCLMALLLFWNQPEKSKNFFLFFFLVFIVGMGTEMIGVNTGWLFGNYQYGNILGKKLNGVPWLIGLNWFVVVFCSASCMQQFQQWFSGRMEKTGTEMPQRLKIFSLIIDGAFLAVFFDWIIEPVAMKLGYWQWQNSIVPFYNYACWFLISVALLLLFWRFSFQKINHFAVHLFIIQLLFFLALRTYS
jgi:putative membrane protein